MGFLTELAIGVGRVVASSLSGASNAVLYSVKFLEEDDDDSSGEASPDEPPYGPLGWYGRPLAPVKNEDATGNSPKGECELLALKTEDSAFPVGVRDLRISAKVNPKEGELGVAHYLGGFISLKVNADGDGTDMMFYSSHQDASGTPDEACAISMDSTAGNRHISLMHARGQSITLTKDAQIILAGNAGDAYIQLGEGSQVVINANSTAITGGVNLGDKNPAATEFLVKSTALLAWIAEVNTTLGVIFAAAGGVVPVTVVPVSVPVATTLTKAT